MKHELARLWLIGAVVLIIAALLWSPGEIEQPPGVLVSQPPRQVLLPEADPFRFEEFTIKPLAQFDIQARVLGIETYRLGPESALSPVDLALGWQHMSNTEVLNQIEITQGNRFYFWRTEQFPIPRKQIESQSANMHLVPANDNIARQLGDARVGGIVSLSGKLIEVTGEEGWQWRSSLTRDDTGNGACEIIWVESVSFAEKAGV